MMNGLLDAAKLHRDRGVNQHARPRRLWHGPPFFNFVAFLVFGLQVAKTMGTVIVSEEETISGTCCLAHWAEPSPGF
jgi:PiT family inorganic phosphate transporter